MILTLHSSTTFKSTLSLTLQRGQSKWLVLQSLMMCEVWFHIQIGENTATVTNLFEVEVNGRLIHSKKVSEAASYAA